MKINKFYLRKSIFIKKNEILNNKKLQQEVKDEVHDKLSVLPEYRSLLGIKRFKLSPDGSIKEDIKNISKKI